MAGPNDDPHSTGEERTFEEKAASVLERLIAAGWDVAGADENVTDTITIGIGLPEHLKPVLSELPMWDDEGNLLSGFDLVIDGDTGVITVDYEGPIDETFEEVVKAMVQLAQDGNASEASINLQLDRLDLSTQQVE